MPTSKQIYPALMEQKPMKWWTTEIWAIKPASVQAMHNGYTVLAYSFAGPHVPGTSLEDAQKYCDTHGLGYCKVYGELIEEGEIETIFDSTN